MLWQQLLNGLVLGVAYSLTALGFSLVYGVLRVVNFAHGNVYMFCAYIGVSAARIFKGNFYLSLLTAMAGGVVLGLALERVIFRPVRTAGTFSGLLTSLGAFFVLGILALMIWGAAPQPYPARIPSQVWMVGRIPIYSMQIVMLVIALALMVALWVVVQKTAIGTAMRAASHSVVITELMGVDVNVVTQFTLAVSSALAAAAGVLVSAYYDVVTPAVGFSAGIKAFTAAVVGGIGSIPGSVLGGLLMGQAESLAAGYLSSGYRDGIAFCILVLVLLVRPTGILGQKVIRKV